MMRPSMPAARAWMLLLAIGAACASTAGLAAELVSNNAFEENNGAGVRGFPGWTVFTQAGSNADGGFFAQTGLLAPLTPFAVPAPPEGSFAAMSDQNGPGSYVLYQDVALPAGSHPMLTARLYVQNEADDFSAPASLDYTTVPNQQARFDLLNPAAAPTDVGAGVLQTLYASQPGDAPMGGYITVSADLSAYAGSTIRLRFAEVDNLEGLLFGIDAVSIHVSSDVATSTVLTGTNNPSVFGQSITLTATVTGQAPTGSVAFLENGMPIGCVATNLTAIDATHAEATCTTAALTTGTHNLTAFYAGNATNLTSTSAVYVQVVDQATTTTTILPPIAVAPAQPAQISVNVAVVAPGSAALSGIVTIADTTDSLSCSYSLPAIGCSITPPSAGTKALTATFTPDASIAANVSGSSGAGQLVVTTNTVTVVGSTSLTPSVYGNSITLSAVVTGQTPTGSVSFTDGATVLCSAAGLVGGGNSPTATCATNTLNAGTHTIQVVYSGDTNNVTANTTITQDVTQATSVVTLSSSPGIVVVGSTVVFTAAVGGISPTGSIVFTDGATVLGTVPLSGGTATLSTSSLALGHHTITAAYSGDANFTAGVASVAITVVPAPVPAPATSLWAMLLLSLGLLAVAARRIQFGLRPIRSARR